MSNKSKAYEAGLHERLRDMGHAVSYIKAAAEDSMDGFLLALRDFVEATTGMSNLAAMADKNRENLYRMLSDEGNPRLDSLWAILPAIGLRLSVEPIKPIEDEPPVAIEPLSVAFDDSVVFNCLDAEIIPSEFESYCLTPEKFFWAGQEFVRYTTVKVDQQVHPDLAIENIPAPATLAPYIQGTQGLQSLVPINNLLQ